MYNHCYCILFTLIIFVQKKSSGLDRLLQANKPPCEMSLNIDRCSVCVSRGFFRDTVFAICATLNKTLIWTNRSESAVQMVV